MKKTLLIIAVILFSTSTAFSQFKLGVGASAGTKTGFSETSDDGFKMNFGLNLRGVYEISDNLAFGFGATYFLPTKFEDGSDEMKMNFIYANADFMYYFTTDESAKFYALGGANFATFTTKFNGTKVDLLSDSSISWEAGLGIEIGKIFIEGKYDGNMEQIIGTVGIYF